MAADKAETFKAQRTGKCLQAGQPCDKGARMEGPPVAMLVTGAAGFIGYHLCRRLLEVGERVIGVDNLVTGQRENVKDLSGHPNFRFIKADITQPLEISEPVSVVWNLACPASPVDFASKSIQIMLTCSQGTYNLLRLALQHKAIFLQASTSECYGDPQVHPQPESYFGNVNPVGVRSPYDEGKRFAEALVVTFHRTYGLPVRIARIFNTYGPRMRADDGRVLPNFIKQALSGAPLTVYGDGKQTRSFCFVSDLVEGLMRLVRTDYAMPVNLGNPEEITILDLAREVIELTGSSSTIEFLPARPEDPALRCPDISLARRLLDWQPKVDRRTGLLKTIDYFRCKLASRC